MVGIIIFAEILFQEVIPQRFRVPHYEQRLRSLHYKKKFAASIAELTPRMRAVLEASRQVARSRRLRKLLELVLALGNYVNRGNARGNACGFRLASLNRLVDTKSSCSKGTTLLHYLVQILESRFREVLDIEEDMPHVRTAARVSMADLQKEVANLKNGLQDVQREIGKIYFIPPFVVVLVIIIIVKLNKKLLTFSFLRIPSWSISSTPRRHVLASDERLPGTGYV